MNWEGESEWGMHSDRRPTHLIVLDDRRTYAWALTLGSRLLGRLNHTDPLRQRFRHHHPFQGVNKIREQVTRQTRYSTFFSPNPVSCASNIIDVP